MKITNKILLYFSSSIIVIATITFLIIYFSFAQYREEEFQQRQKEKIITTLQLITQVQKAESEIIESLNLVNINSLLEEKLLIFNKNKELIYSSLDDVPITYSKDLILHLNTKHPWIERKDGLYDVVAVYFTWNDNVFYGISKAYDTFGYTKLRFLSQVLITSFIALLIVIFIVSILLAKKISKPIIDLQQSISQYPLDEQYTPLPLSKTYWEVDRLTEVFNHLLQRVNEAMLFQKQTVHQISHELKTPIAILVSELEKTRSLLDDKKAKILLEQNINNAKYLAEIINILLAMSKIESGQSLPQKHIRVDEIIFNLIEDLNILYPHFHFNFQFLDQDVEEKKLTVYTNEMLLQQAILNLLNNSIAYSSNHQANIQIGSTTNHQLSIQVSNTGATITDQEQKYLFSPFFRGENSKHKTGFGLGLSWTQKIVLYCGGDIRYEANEAQQYNTFIIKLPLS